MSESQKAWYYTRIVSSVILICLGSAFIIWGFYTMYAYGNQDLGETVGHIVGGDAYNFIIIGVRGLGMIVAGGAWFISGSVLLRINTLLNKSEETKTEVTAPCLPSTPESLQN